MTQQATLIEAPLSFMHGLDANGNKIKKTEGSSVPLSGHDCPIEDSSSSEIRILRAEPNVRLLLSVDESDADAESDERFNTKFGLDGNGTLFVTDKQLYWFNEESNRGLAIDYTVLMMHAISRADPEVGPSLYCQLAIKDFHLSDGTPVPIEQEDAEEEDALEEDFEPLVELRFVPSNEESIDAIFDAVCSCSALYASFDDADQDSESAFDEENFMRAALNFRQDDQDLLQMMRSANEAIRQSAGEEEELEAEENDDFEEEEAEYEDAEEDDAEFEERVSEKE